MKWICLLSIMLTPLLFSDNSEWDPFRDEGAKAIPNLEHFHLKPWELHQLLKSIEDIRGDDFNLLHAEELSGHIKKVKAYYEKVDDYELSNAALRKYRQLGFYVVNSRNASRAIYDFLEDEHKIRFSIWEGEDPYWEDEDLYLSTLGLSGDPLTDYYSLRENRNLIDASAAKTLAKALQRKREIRDLKENVIEYGPIAIGGIVLVLSFRPLKRWTRKRWEQIPQSAIFKAKRYALKNLALILIAAALIVIAIKL